MIELTVPLRGILDSPETTTDLASMPPDEAKSRIVSLYAFLGVPVDVDIEGDQARIVIHHEPTKPADETTKLFRRGIAHADKGDYHRAINVFRMVTQEMPMLADARRNLGMAQLNSGKIAEAKETLIQAVRLYPTDSWGYLLLGNLYAKHESNFALAEQCYRKALELDPNDVYALTSYGGLCLDVGKKDQARELFTRALATGNVHPNAYYGLALLEMEQGDPAASMAVLERLFDAEPSSDIRSAALYREARKLYMALCRSFSQVQKSRLMALVQERARALEQAAGIPVEMIEDSSFKDIQAVAQSAWRHHADRHVIRYSPDEQIVLPHLLAHEIEHLRMEHEDREAGTNRMFTSSAAGREYAIRSLGKDVVRLQKMGYAESSIADVVIELVNNLLRQLHSTPLDMIVERRLYDDLPALRQNQLVSLDVTNERSLQVLSNPQVQRVTPSFIYDTSAALNAAYALFIDDLSSGRTALATAYPSKAVATGRRLLGLWRDAMQSYAPGAEYDLVDRFADVLRMGRWYEWLADSTQDQEQGG